MTRGLFPLLAGFTLWTLAFVFLYTLQALGCVWGWPDSIHRASLVGMWVVTLGGLGLFWFFQSRRADRNVIERAGLVATVAAIGATIVTYFPVTFATLCL
jgi:hypothetical protein